MNDVMFVKGASKLWNVSERRVRNLCEDGKIIGAFKQGKSWLIPRNAKKPVDGRVKSSLHYKENLLERLLLPIGVSDYRLASTEYFYVDKTLMIKDFIDERPMVSLFTRPRRFGKTLNMDMLRTFFEKTDEDTSIYFEDKLIWSCGQKYRDYQGKFPVIFVSFKDVKRETWEATYDLIYKILRNEFERHNELLNSSKLSSYSKEYIRKVLDGKATENDIMLSLSQLSQMLDEHYDKKTIIIVDGYDVPIQQGHLRGFYDKVILFMQNLFFGWI